MKANIFIPQHEKPAAAATPVADTQPARSLWSLKLTHVALLLLSAGLLVVFMPGLWASLGFTKAVFALLLVGLVAVFGVLHVVTQPRVTLVIPKALLVLWILSGLAILGSLLTPQTEVALRGSYLEVQTAAFITLFTAVVTVGLTLVGTPKVARRMIMVLAVSAAAVLFYVFLRIIFGPEFLSLGSFGAVTITPVGGFNDLAIVAGVLLIGALSTLSSASVTRTLQIILVTIVVLSLAVLVAVNFTLIWWLVGLAVAGIGVKQLLENKVGPGGDSDKRITLLLLAAVVLAVSGWYGLVSSEDGTFMQEWADVSYVEVRPSFTATTDIVRSVYGEQALLGAGPNQFSTAWRMHKDLSINETIFWNTEFVSGYSFLLTQFVQLGLLGGVLLILFQLWFLYAGYRALTAPESASNSWQSVTAVSFVASIFLWILLDLYTPGSAVLLLTALVTGIAIVGIATLRPSTALVVPIVRRGDSPSVAKIIVVLLVFGFVGSISYSFLGQYRAESSVNRALAEGSLSREVIRDAYALYPDHRFLGLQAQLSAIELRQLAQNPEPSAEDQERFLAVAEQAVEESRSAVEADRIGIASHIVMASVFNTLANTGVSGARDVALETLQTAKVRDAKNPELTLAEAQVYVQEGNIESARESLEATLALKQNYTPALILLTEIDIAEGDLVAAIERTSAVVTLEPRNPTRYFQLGVLYAANQQLEQAEAAYSAALILDPQYANARYMLAQLYLLRGENEAALAALEKVQSTNQDNPQLQQLIDNLQAGTTTEPATTPDVELDESTVDVTAENEVVTSEAPDTELIVPVNAVSSDSEQ